MKTSSCKAKGRNLQNKVVEELLTAFPELEPDDCKPAIMGESGVDIKLSPAARKLIPYSIECKNQEKLNIWSALNQAENNAGSLEPVLIFKRNRSKIYAVVELEEFIKLIKKKMKTEVREFIIKTQTEKIMNMGLTPENIICIEVIEGIANFTCDIKELVDGEKKKCNIQLCIDDIEKYIIYRRNEN